MVFQGVGKKRGWGIPPGYKIKFFFEIHEIIKNFVGGKPNP